MTLRHLARLALATFVFAALTAPAIASPLPPSPGSPNASFDVGTLHVDEYGSGGPGNAVILIPGLGAGPWEWYGVIAHLAPAHRVYAVTLPGFDGREPSDSPGHVFDSTHQALLDLIAHEQLHAPVIIGHDLGGALAIDFAERSPHVARAIVVVDATPVAVPLAYLSPEERLHQADSAAASFTRDPTMIRPMALQNVGTTGAIDPATTNAILDEQESADNTALALAMREMLAGDLRPDLGKIVVPMLVMVPYYLPDNSTPPSIQPPIVHTVAQKLSEVQALYADAKTAKLVPIQPSRHFIMLDDPDGFDAALDAFLAAHSS